MKNVKIVGRSKDWYGKMIVKYEVNPMLNTMVYNAEFIYGSIREYGANVISNNVDSQVYSEGFLHYILSGILGFSKDTTYVQKGNQYSITKLGLLDGNY